MIGGNGRQRQNLSTRLKDLCERVSGAPSARGRNHDSATNHSQSLRRVGCRRGGATMKSSIIKRSVIVNGHKTSISLEDEFWTEVKAIASQMHATISELLTDIDRAT